MLRYIIVTNLKIIKHKGISYIVFNKFLQVVGKVDKTLGILIVPFDNCVSIVVQVVLGVKIRYWDKNIMNVI